MLLKKDKQYGIVLCGGSGTRLWPISRTIRPKHLITFYGKHSLLQNTLIRITKKIPPQNIFLVTNKEHEFIIKDQLSRIFNNKKPKIILEPYAKNTLPAVAYGIRKIMEIEIDATISIFPADHEIKNTNKFLRDWENAILLAKKDYFTLIGIKPQFASTGFGYIKPSRKINNTNAFDVAEFIEKPNIKLANELFKKGYLWNSGMFVLKSSLFTKLMNKYQKKLLTQINSINDKNIDEIYNQLKSISIDYGLAEKAEKVGVINSNFQWNDLGNWEAIHNLLPSDIKKNSKVGDVVQLKTENCMLWNESGTLATYGISNLIVVNTDDATLVCTKNDVEHVKDLVSSLKKIKSESIETHQKVFRPWGNYTVLEQGPGFKIKRIEVKPKQKLSLQLHKKRSEHWVVIEGTARVTNGKKALQIKKNESTFIPQGTKHRLENPNTKTLIIIEVQVGIYVGEDDIIRFEDKYNRLK